MRLEAPFLSYVFFTELQKPLSFFLRSACALRAVTSGLSLENARESHPIQVWHVLKNSEMIMSRVLHCPVSSEGEGSLTSSEQYEFLLCVCVYMHAYVHMYMQMRMCGIQKLTLCDFLYNSPSCYCFGGKGVYFALWFALW